MPARYELAREGASTLTVFAPFTRAWCVERFFAALAASDVPMGDALFVGYVDSDDDRLSRAVRDAALALPFASVVIHTSGFAPPAEKAGGNVRRPRHAMMRSASCALIPDGPLLLLEDDTLIPPDTYAKLSAVDADWVSGFEVGRWSDKCPGIWRIVGRRIYARPSSGVEAVDATGLYCALTTARVYRSAPWHTWDNAMGHDVYCTNELTKQGYSLAADWSVECVHMTPKKDLTCDMVQRYEKDAGPAQMHSLGGGAPLTGPIVAHIAPGRPDATKGVPEVAKAQGGTGKQFRTLARVVRNGTVVAGPHELVRLDWAIEEGLADPEGRPRQDAVYESRGGRAFPAHRPYVPTMETKPVDPVEATKDPGDPAAPLPDGVFDTSTPWGNGEPQPEAASPSEDLSTKTMPSLKALAKERGVDISGLRKKAEIIAKLNA